MKVTPHKCFLALCLWVSTGLAPAALLAQSSGEALTAPSSQSLISGTPSIPVWENSGHWTFGFGTAYAVENAIPRNISHINLVWVQPQIGLVVWQSPQTHFIVHRFDLINEGMFGGSPGPGGHLAGNTLLFRFEGKPLHTRFVPLFEFGAGILNTNLSDRAPELNGETQFCPQGGFGVQYFVRPQRALVFEYRYMHMSNAGIQGPNLGFNASMIVLGFRWLRRPKPPAR